jgi:hypothetical protein
MFKHSKIHFFSDLNVFTDDLVGKANYEFSEMCREEGIQGKMIFNVDQLLVFIKKTGCFSIGFVCYFKQLQKQFDPIKGDQKVKLDISQTFLELGSVIFTQNGSYYSITPNELKPLEKQCAVFIKEIEDKNPAIKQIEPLFASTLLPRTLFCIVASCLCNAFNQTNSRLVDDNNQYVGHKLTMQPQFKPFVWIHILAFHIARHRHFLLGIGLTADQTHLIQWYSFELANKITNHLLEQGLFGYYKSIQSNPLNITKTTSYFVWKGSNLSTYPKALPLPMILPPENWSPYSYQKPRSYIQKRGGYMICRFNEQIMGQYFNRAIHLRTLKYRNADLYNHFNSLQGVPFAINAPMVKFLYAFYMQLTNSGIALLSNKWVTPKKDLIQAIYDKAAKRCKKKKSSQVNCSTSPAKGEKSKGNALVQQLVVNELVSKQKQTLSNQANLIMSELYRNRTFYWPILCDSRGDLYRIGHLNIQDNQFARSFISFHSDKALVNRKQSKYIQAKFDLLLKEVLVNKTLIEQWHTVFGNRLIDKNQFNQLLLNDVLAKKLSLIQVGQLLLIRQGAYDRVGVYYDTSTSVDQIMALVNGDKLLYEATLQSTSGTKQDIYGLLGNLLTNQKYSVFNIEGKALNKRMDWLEQQNLIKQKISYRNYFKHNLDRRLVKTVVMQLIYKKKTTPQRRRPQKRLLWNHLAKFFAKGGLYPSKSFLMVLGKQIIRNVQKTSTFQKRNHFITAIRSIGTLLLDSNTLTLRESYTYYSFQHDTTSLQGLRLYFKKSNTKQKTINQFVTDYVHFLKRVSHHYVLRKLAKEGDLAFDKVDHAFFIKPTQAGILNQLYKEGLVMALIVHQYNLIYWLSNFIDYMGLTKDVDQEAFEFLYALLLILDTFVTKDSIHWKNLEIPNTKLVIQRLEYLKGQLSLSKNKALVNDIIQYLNVCPFEDSHQIAQEILSYEGEILFPKNR